MNGGKDTDKYKHEFYHYRKCVLLDACLSFQFLECSYNGDVIVDYYFYFNYKHNRISPPPSTKQTSKIEYNDDKLDLLLDNITLIQ